MPLRVFTLVLGISLFSVPNLYGQKKTGDFFKSFDLPRKAAATPGKNPGNAGTPAGTVDIEPPPSVQEQAGELLTSGEAHPSLVMEDYPALLTLEEYDQFRKIRSAFSRVAEAGVTDAESREVLNNGLKTLLHALTIQEFQKDQKANEVLRLIFRDAVFKAGRDISQSVAKQQFREQFFDAMMPTLKELLQHNYFVRLRAAIILANMDTVAGKLREGVPPVPYHPAALLAMELLSSDQPEAVKIQAARCVEKSLRYAVLTDATRLKMTQACVEELLNDSQTWWYKNALIDCLIASNLDLHEGKPFIIQALALILSDPTQHKMARSHAAYALGRVPMSSKMQINLHLLCYEIVSLSVSMAEERNNFIKLYQNTPPDQFMSQWGICFQRNYLAYNPTNQQELELGFGLNQRITKPGMGAQADIVTASYGKVLAFYKHCMQIDNLRAPFPDALITSGKEWLDEYPPGDFRVSPTTQPLVGLDDSNADAESGQVTAR